ncbi:DUF58 domain-containing protein [Virgibacillus oceani]|uniref:DUF58 domain-containing protein n=1 Tax=Virgibacillus oceani TaxID=1479511 RepID=A0A917LZV4_9BACI|nr:DUF58 domain-containing protein [Virgibacillus oceani]GGG66730.1 hypothetical protein GCM10011398_07970 [Virgibacillus oceani]
MIWQKEFGISNDKNYDYLLAAIVVLVVLGFLFKKPILFIVVGLFTAYLLLNKFYDKRIGDKLYLENSHRVLRMFPGDELELTFEFQNRSFFPILNGEFQFQTEQSIEATKYVESSSKYWNQFSLPLSVVGKGKVTVQLPIKAKQRGTSKIKNINYKFPHLFNFDSVTLKYNPFYQLEYVVFPEPIQVKGIEAISYVTPGIQHTNFSPFEDVHSPRGTRDYSYSDPFHQINWKASAKTQELQTNVYDKVVDMSYLFIVNLSTKHSLNMLHKDMEKLLSYTAYLCQYATKKGYPFEMVINARKPGSTPYMNLPEGEGKAHYVHALEMLARIRSQSMIVPLNQMLHRVGQTFYKPKTIILIGQIPNEVNQIIGKWKQTQKNIFQLEQMEDEACLKRLVRDVINHAN